MNEFWQLTELEQQALGLSLKVALWCVVGSLIPGIVCSWILVRSQFYGKVLLEGLIHLPLVMPPIATGYALLLLFGKKGIFGQWLDAVFGISFAFSWKGAVLASIVVSFPLLVRTVNVSMEAVDQKLEEAARTLGAKPWRIFFTITFPLIVPGILSGMVLAFARSLGEFGATITFVSNIQGETATIPLTMFSLLQQPGTENATLRLLFISIGLSLLALFASEWLNRRIKNRRVA